MFSKDFYYGASTAGFQVEMGSGKAIDPNTDWFVWTRDKLNAENGIVSGDDPAQGCDYWYNYKAFHDLAQNAGMNMLRIGVEWSRIFPEATFGIETPEELAAVADSEAVTHYREIMKDIKDRDITLMVNLNHFTLPLWLHDPIKVNRERDMTSAGWVDERSIHEFEKYAGFMTAQIDDLVDMWSTQNEPNVVAMPYNSIQMGFPPCIIAPDLGEKVLDNEAKAHNAAFDAMKKHTSKPVGCIYAIGIATGDEEAVKEATAHELSRYLDKVQDKMDFLGVNYYSRSAVLKKEDGEIKALSNYGQGCKPNDFSGDGRVTSDFGWEFYPEGLYNTLKLLYERYGVDLYVTENGTSDSKDGIRQAYLISHMNMVERLIENGVPVKGYLHWSLVDNFEWASGYGQRFGLVHVNYETKKLTTRGSYFIMKDIIERGTTKDYEYLLKYPYDIFDEKNLMK